MNVQQYVVCILRNRMQSVRLRILEMEVRSQSMLGEVLGSIFSIQNSLFYRSTKLFFWVWRLELFEMAAESLRHTTLPFDIISILSWIQVLRTMLGTWSSRQFFLLSLFSHSIKYVPVTEKKPQQMLTVLAIDSNNSILIMGTKVYGCCLRHYTSGEVASDESLSAPLTM